MPHPRKILRNFVAEYLAAPDEDEAFRTDAGAAVFAGRDLPFGREDFTTGILVYTPEEDVDRDHMHQGGQRRRTMRLEVQCYAMGDDGEDVSDDLAWQAETALLAIPTLENRVESCHAVRTESAFAGDGDQALWVTNLIYEVTYWTQEIVPDGERPTIILLGWDPETGPGNEEKYIRVDELPDPEDIP